MTTYYITTPIYYVNDIPHIGHAYTTLAADVLSRFKRLDGFDVKFLTGTDEHGQKVEKAAEKQGISPQEFTDKISKPFRDLCGTLNFQNDDFIRTTEERHKKAATYFWNKLQENGHIYEGKYSGWYSVRDEAFYAESELTEAGLAPTGAPVEWVEEASFFFDLSKWQDKLLEFYETNPDFIRPSSRRNEVISFVKGGLLDLSISRTTSKWGIPVPGHPEHVMYVWLDALTNYISALGYPENTSDFSKFWPANVHIVGKDILRFHAVYWPAFLMAAGITPPKTIFAHGWWTNEGEKISKSLGNVIDPVGLVQEFGVDYVRYYLMREVILGNDGNFSRSGFVARINSELANKIGNLAQRTLAFINKNCDAKVPEILNPKELILSSSLIKLAYGYLDKFRGNIDNQDINSVMDGIVKLAEEANIYIDAQAPWALKKTDVSKMNEVLFILLETIRIIGIYLIPFIPESANKILDQLDISSDERSFKNISAEYILKAGSTLPTPEPIFKRLE